MASIIAIKRGVYQVRIFLGKINGKVKHHNHTIHGTLKDAKKYEAEYKLKLSRGLNPFNRLKTLTELIFKYKEQMFPFFAPNTQNVKTQIYNNHLIPAFGKDLFITREAAGCFVSNLIKSGYSSSMIRNIIREANCLYNFAVDNGIISENPFSRLRLPQKQNKIEIKPLNAEEIKRFLSYSPQNKTEILFRLAFVTGSRPSEYLALKWEDLDLINGFLGINRSSYEKQGGTQIRETTKTKTSKRRISLDTFTLQLLKNLKLDEKSKDTDYIFTEKGKLLTHSQVAYRFKRFLKKIKLRDIRLYWLRHSSATFLLNEGLPVKDVSKRLGHASAFMTLNIYSQALDENENKAAEKFNPPFAPL